MTPQVHSTDDAGFKAAMALSDATRELLVELSCLTQGQLIQWAKNNPLIAESFASTLRAAAQSARYLAKSATQKGGKRG